MQFTASAETYEKLRLAQALLRHQIPDGDPAAIFDRALTALLQSLTKQKFAATDRPRGSRGAVPHSRYIPAEVKRAVWKRDGGQCAFVSHTGRRCCRAHIGYEAELHFGLHKPPMVREMRTPYMHSTPFEGRNTPRLARSPAGAVNLTLPAHTTEERRLPRRRAGLTLRLFPSRWRLATAVTVTLGVLLVVILLFTLAAYSRALEERRQAEIENAVAIGRTLSTVVNGFVSDVENTMGAMALALGAEAGPPDQSTHGPYLAAVFREYGILRSLFVTDLQGRVIVSYAGRELGRDLSSRPYIGALRSGAPAVWSDLLLGLETGQVTVAHGRAVLGPEGRARAYLVAAFFPERVLERLPFSLPPDARVTLLDRRGQILYTTDTSTLAPTQRDFSSVPEVRRALAGETVRFPGRRGLQSGEARYGVIVPISRTGWAVSFTRPVAPLEARLRAAFLRQGLELGAALLLAGLLASLFVGRLTRPLRVLAGTAAAVAQGDRPVVPPSGGPPEVQQLANAMAVMSRAVAEREDALQRALRRRQELYRLTDAANRALGLEEIAGPAMDALQTTLGAPRAALLLLDEHGIMHFVASRGLSPAYQAAVEGHSPWPAAVRDPQPVVIANVSADTSLNESIRTAVRTEGIRSMAFIPLVYRDRLIGKFMVYDDVPHLFIDEELQLAQTIAAHVAFAVERQRGAEALASAYAAEQTARAEAETARSRLAFLVEASSLLTSSMDYETTLKHLARLAVPRIADWCAVYTFQGDESIQRLEIAHTDPSMEERVKAIISRRPDPQGLQTPMGQSLRLGRTMLVEEITDNWVQQATPDEGVRGLMREIGLRSLMVVPLVARGETIGAILFATAGARSFGPDEVALAEELARRASVAVDNSRLFEREHVVARTLQQAFLPEDIPQVPGAVLHAAYLPASGGADVGGDWYDAFWLPDGRLGLAIGDVTGKGVEAAVTMGQVRQGIRATWDAGSPSAVLLRVAQLFRLMPSQGMASVLFGLLDPGTRTFTYASAGHPPPIVAEPDGRVRVLEGGGAPLGMQRETLLHDWTVALAPGALLVLYTDGLIEVDRNPIQGERQLHAAAALEVSTPSSDRAWGICERVLAGRKPRDDVAVLTVSIATVPAGGGELSLPATPLALPLVRQAVRQFAEAAGVDPARLAGLQIAVGEAVNNVLEHAYGLAPGDLTLRTAVEKGLLAVEIEDRGRWRHPRGEGGGWGLTVMRGLVDRAVVTPGEHGTKVRVELILDPTLNPQGGGRGDRSPL